MGDRYLIQLKCAYCNKLNKGENDMGVCYAESSNFTDFFCEFCEKKNKIIMRFESEKIKARKKMKK